MKQVKGHKDTSLRLLLSVLQQEHRQEPEGLQQCLETNQLRQQLRTSGKDPTEQHVDGGVKGQNVVTLIGVSDWIL